MKPSVRALVKEEDVIKDLSLHFCPATSERRTVFWLPAPDEVIDHSESKFSERGYPTVAPNGEFFEAFPEYWTRFDPERSPLKTSQLKP